MIEKLNITQDELSNKVSKSRSYITNILGLLRLPLDVQKMIANGELSMSHARVLSKLEDESKILEYAKNIVEQKMPVREIEEITIKEDKKNQIKRKPKEIDKEFKYVEDLLRDKLDTKIKIKDKKIEISFNNVADLNRILEILNVIE